MLTPTAVPKMLPSSFDLCLLNEYVSIVVFCDPNLNTIKDTKYVHSLDV